MLVVSYNKLAKSSHNMQATTVLPCDQIYVTNSYSTILNTCQITITSKFKIFQTTKQIHITEPQHDKTNNVAVRPAKTQISLDIHPV